MSAEDERGPLDDLGFLIGRWRVDGQAFPAAYGATGRFGGDVIAEYGPQKAWIRLEQTANLGPAGTYAVTVLLFFDTSLKALRAFSVNSFGSGQVYAGVLHPSDELVCTSVSTSSDEPLQRVTYAFLETGRVRFTVEISSDGGKTYQPFSEAVWSLTAQPC